MARKGNQQKNGLDSRSSNQKKGVSDSGSGKPNPKRKGKGSAVKVVGEELPNGNQPNIPLPESANETNQVEKNQSLDEIQGLEQPVPCVNNLRDCVENLSTTESSDLREENETLPIFSQKNPKSSLNCSLNGLHANDTKESEESVVKVTMRHLRTLTLSISKASIEWLERQKPLFVTVTTKVLNGRDYARVKLEHAYPVVLKWVMHMGKILLLLSMVWLDCAVRGIDSFLRMGTTSFFAVIWCSIFSVLAMIGMPKFLIIMVSLSLCIIFKLVFFSFEWQKIDS